MQQLKHPSRKTYYTKGIGLFKFNHDKLSVGKTILTNKLVKNLTILLQQTYKVRSKIYCFLDQNKCCRIANNSFMLGLFFLRTTWIASKKEYNTCHCN
jgi:hypothetical protein